jgi:hypothetical protein
LEWLMNGSRLLRRLGFFFVFSHVVLLKLFEKL